MTHDEMLAALHDEMPFTALLGIEPVAATKDEVRIRLPWSEKICTAGGVVHGGVLMSLADSTGAFCAFLNLPEGAGTTTIESKTNFLRGVREGHVEAVSKPLHAGRTVIVIETGVYDADNRLVAKTTQTQAVLAPR
jgi:1,4-dihydroxy-2-naphthoyl-CoA hydrolase